MSGQGDRRRSYGIEEGKNNIRGVGSFGAEYTRSVETKRRELLGGSGICEVKLRDISCKLILKMPETAIETLDQRSEKY